MKELEDRLHLDISQAMRLRGIPPGKTSRAGVLWFTIEHRNAASIAEGGRRKAVGVVPGVPDTLIMWPKAKTLWIELKTATGDLSADQKLLHPAMRATGQRIEIVRSVEQWFVVLALYGVPIALA